jgi:RNase P/RNase MRP subunit p30
MKTDYAWANKTGPGFDTVKEIEIINSESQARKSKGFLDTTDYKVKRKCVEKKWVQGLIPSTKIDDVLAKFMAKNRVSYTILFNRVSDSKDQVKTMGILVRDLRLCRKFGVDVKIGSGAKTEKELRSAEVLASFLECLGLDKKRAKEGLQ